MHRHYQTWCMRSTQQPMSWLDQASGIRNLPTVKRTCAAGQVIKVPPRTVSAPATELDAAPPAEAAGVNGSLFAPP